MLEYITISGSLFGADGPGGLDLATIAPWALGGVFLLFLMWFFFLRR